MDKFFETLCTDYHVKVYKYLYYSLGKEEDAKDITQDVFIHIYKNLDKVISHENIGGYIMQVAKYKKLNHIRKLSTRSKHEIMVEVLPESKTTTDIDEQISIDRDRSIDETQYLEEVYSRIEERYKEFYRQYYIERLTYKEIAQINRVSQTSLRMMNLRLKKHIRQITKDIAKEKFVTNL